MAKGDEESWLLEGRQRHALLFVTSAERDGVGLVEEIFSMLFHVKVNTATYSIRKASEEEKIKHPPYTHIVRMRG